MKVAVCGGRGERIFDERVNALCDTLRALGATMVVTGGCVGVDEDAEEIARMEMGLETTTFRPQWDEYGKAAGPLRNQEIAEYSDALIAFPGGRGTQDMVHRMEKIGKKVVHLK